MAILVDKNSRVMVQGITGGAGKFHTERMLEYGTNIVGGTSPGKGGQDVLSKPVFDTVAECVESTGADVSVIFLPARFVMEAAIEAIRAGIKFLVVIARASRSGGARRHGDRRQHRRSHFPRSG
jgi:succinyl-CoA synthetase alpha subunit